MIKYKDSYKNKWADLSNLPTKNNGKHIDWKNSVGMSVDFQYEVVSGQIHIVGHKVVKSANGQNMVMISIVIDKYVPEPIYVYTKVLKCCELRHLVHNKIADVTPHVMQYLVDQQDGYKYAWQSDKYVKTVCPICGHIELKRVGCLCKNGFFCPICSDGISIPNKIMNNVLSQINVQFKREIGQADFKWMKKYFYDFYFQTSDCIDVLVEMDGGLHTRLKEQQDRDKIKDRLAYEHNFKLIRIDCDYKNARHKAFDYIKSNILDSELSILLPLENVDWTECYNIVKNNIMVQVCDMWENQGFSCGEIVDIMQLHRTTVCTYLKRGREIGLCPSYSTKESLHRRNRYKNYVSIKQNNTK